MAIDSFFILFLQSYRNPLFDYISLLFAYAFSTQLMLLLSVVILFFGYVRKIKEAILAFAAIFFNFVVVALLKYTLKRARPPYAINLPMLPYTKYSFPSGHTAMAFLIAFILSKKYPNYSIFFYTIAILVAISRMYLGLHYLSDVVVGAVIGLTIGWLSYHYKKNIINLSEKIIKY
jgi:undecaprenyl-diphosphatase